MQAGGQVTFEMKATERVHKLVYQVSSPWLLIGWFFPVKVDQARRPLQGEAQFIQSHAKIWTSALVTRHLTLDSDWGEMKWNEPGRREIRKRARREIRKKASSWQWAKHGKLYSDLFQAYHGKLCSDQLKIYQRQLFIAQNSQQRGGFDFCIRDTRPQGARIVHLWTTGKWIKVVTACYRFIVNVTKLMSVLVVVF